MVIDMFGVWLKPTTPNGRPPSREEIIFAIVLLSILVGIGMTTV